MKLRDIGIRVVYKLEYADELMRIIIISTRSDEQVYKDALRRRYKYNL